MTKISTDFIKIDLEGLADLRKEFRDKPHILRGAIRRAVNRTGVTARQRIATAVRRDLGNKIKLGELKQRNITLRRAVGNQLGATITTKGGRIPLRRFAARATKKGVTYDLGQGRRTAVGAFMATTTRTWRGDTHSGHDGVYARVGKARLPIRELVGPSAPHVMQTVFEIQRLQKSLQGELNKQVSHEVGRAMRRRR